MQPCRLYIIHSEFYNTTGRDALVSLVALVALSVTSSLTSSLCLAEHLLMLGTGGAYGNQTRRRNPLISQGCLNSPIRCNHLSKPLRQTVEQRVTINIRALVMEATAFRLA